VATVKAILPIAKHRQLLPERFAHSLCTNTAGAQCCDITTWAAVVRLFNDVGHTSSETPVWIHRATTTEPQHRHHCGSICVVHQVDQLKLAICICDLQPSFFESVNCSGPKLRATTFNTVHQVIVQWYATEYCTEFDIHILALGLVAQVLAEKGDRAMLVDRRRADQTLPLKLLDRKLARQKHVRGVGCICGARRRPFQNPTFQDATSVSEL